ncbi:MAG: preprotein translocase subunit SecA [Vampirovibrionales bacterium]|nr:preprotein translocase subunit SecA [Vampirovibrionales bacterium]
MFGSFNLIHKILGDPNARKVRKLDPTVDMINRFEPELEALSDDELRAKTAWFREELANRPRDPDPGRDFKLEQEALEWLLPEAFAVVREAGRRTLGMRHYDVQLVGGMILHKGGIAEMRTGEGKTLVATLPVYLNALTGRGVHVVTVNDYLAKRDAEWMGAIYQFLGLSVGVVLSEQRGFDSFAQKKAAYAADITYGTNNEFGFDYLRDNMAGSLAQMAQRPYYYAIIDEVDSILIDEARTPLIISGRVEQSAETYQSMARLAPLLQKDADYTVDEKARNVILTEDGIDRAQDLLKVDDLFDPRSNLAHHLLQALKAKELFRRDIDYLVRDGEVVIVDEFRGRTMEGRRWSDGLHQAVEAKEGVRIQDETQTLASITFQNLFRLYPKLGGMTGTALTEEAEFGKIYNLEVTAIPTNRPDVRQDGGDVIYKTEQVKFFKAVEELVESHRAGRPVLVGTTSIENSERISALLSTPAEMTRHLREKAQRLAKAIEGDKDLSARWAPLLKNPEAVDAQTLLQAAEQDGVSGDFADFMQGLARTRDTLQAIRDGIAHHVLNAKRHEQEAMIVAQAGREGAVTIATNMAGRGTDILLGGNAEYLAKDRFLQAGRDWRDASPQEFEAALAQMRVITEAEKERVVAAGGLHIIGTERHESRRIDNQLRGRAARQGDPGSTRFYLSLEDSLMRIFGGHKVSGLMDFLNVDETMPITAPMVSRVIESAQRKVEAYHFEMRKNVLKYDDVMTEQRKLIYGQRRQVLEGRRLRESVTHMLSQEIERLTSASIAPDIDPADRDPEMIADFLMHLHGLIPQLATLTAADLEDKPYGALLERVQEEALRVYEALEAQISQVAAELDAQHGIQLLGLHDDAAEADALSLVNGASPEAGARADTSPPEDQDSAEEAHYRHPLRRIERDILLSVIDAKWIDYLHSLDALRDGIGLRAYGQKDPLLEYKREAFEMFQAMTYDIQRESVALLFRANIEIQVDRHLDDAGDDDAFVDTALTDALLSTAPGPDAGGGVTRPPLA